MKNMKVKAATVLVATVASFGAAADSPASAALASISAEASSLIADAWPIAVAVTVALVGIKLFKKVASRAT